MQDQKLKENIEMGFDGYTNDDIEEQIKIIKRPSISNPDKLFKEYPKLKVKGGGKLFNFCGDLYWRNVIGRTERVVHGIVWEMSSGDFRFEKIDVDTIMKETFFDKDKTKKPAINFKNPYTRLITHKFPPFENVPIGTRRCGECGIIFPLREFRCGRKKRYHYDCRECKKMKRNLQKENGGNY